MQKGSDIKKFLPLFLFPTLHTSFDINNIWIEKDWNHLNLITMKGTISFVSYLSCSFAANIGY